jgi:hypothetical protein
MKAAATLSPSKVAELSGAPKRIIEKAIEESAIEGLRSAIPSHFRGSFVPLQVEHQAGIGAAR